MDDVLNDLKEKWDGAKKRQLDQSLNPQDLIIRSKQKMRSTIILYFKNIVVLMLTLIGISCFFVFVAPFQELTSHIGIFLMIGGLILRIALECFSIYRSSNIDLSKAASEVAEQYRNFYSYRKQINGPFTVGVLIAYSIGFYMLIPEFSIYFNTPAILLLSFSYLLAAAIFGFFIRKAIRDETKYLDDIIELQKDIRS